MIIAPVFKPLFFCMEDFTEFCSPQNLAKGIEICELQSGVKKQIFSLYQLELGKKYVSEQGHQIKRKTEREIIIKQIGNSSSRSQTYTSDIPHGIRSSAPIAIVGTIPPSNVSPISISNTPKNISNNGNLEGTSPFFIMMTPPHNSRMNSSPFGSSVGSRSDNYSNPVIGSLEDFETIPSEEIRSSTPDSELRMKFYILNPNIPGEKLDTVIPEISLVRNNVPQIGNLYFTNYQLIFQSLDESNQSTEFTHSIGFEESSGKDISSLKLEESLFFLPYATIARFEKIDRQNGNFMFGENSYSLEIFSKDFRRPFRFSLTPSKHVRRDICNLLSKYIFPTLNNVFALASGQTQFDGWNFFDPKEEYARFKVGEPNSPWRISDVNSNYSLCSSYPVQLVVPKDISDEELKSVSSFRSKGRIPVLAWLSENGASLTRCSQPKTGMSRTFRCKADETLLGLIQASNPNTEKLYILDARPMVNAVTQMALGGGYENITFYVNTELEFMGIPNIHVVRESYYKLRDLCEQFTSESVLKTVGGTWFSQLEGTHWLEYISGIMSSVRRIVELISLEKASVLVHCSDGWDRTPQVCSLAQICLDSYYRSIDGFCKLIEKEWLHFGHKFGERFGLNMEDSTFKDSERSPVFLQFLDTTWQLILQFPEAFEFNEELLILLIEGVYSGRFGTFLLNSVRERERSDLPKKTPSIWPYIMSQKNTFLNPFYYPKNQPKVLLPQTDLKHLHLWSSYYFRYLCDSSCFSEPKIYSVGVKMKKEIDSLKSEVEKLQQDLQKLQQPTNSVSILHSSTSSSPNHSNNQNYPPLPLSKPNIPSSPTIIINSYSSSQSRDWNYLETTQSSSKIGFRKPLLVKTD